jgi:hypothetical protein
MPEASGVERVNANMSENSRGRLDDRLDQVKEKDGERDPMGCCDAGKN